MRNPDQILIGIFLFSIDSLFRKIPFCNPYEQGFAKGAKNDGTFS